jgi:hypothetical protein
MSMPGQYHMGALPMINFAYVKSLCDSQNVQMNFIFRPDQIEIKVSRIDPVTKLLNKSEKHVIRNHEIAQKFNTNTLELIIKNTLMDVFPTNMPMYR